jgi:adenine phosphoribosyltransferase
MAGQVGIEMRVADLKKTIREVPDFPKPGINFYDVSTLFRNAEALQTAVEVMVERYRGERIDALAGIEARGFILASAMACRLGVGLILARKQGKLPGETESETYSLEYGEAVIEVHRDAAQPGDRVVVIDDLLATGGTAAATGRILQRLGATVTGYGFMVELEFLEGRRELVPNDVFALLKYA